VQWNFVGAIPRTVRDDSGMGLFDAGARTAPFTQWASFGAAGVYRYHCALDGSLPATTTVAPTTWSFASVSAVV
jgi:hypothetical protein